jgi:hypothetical protein
VSFKAWNAAMPTTAAMSGVATANGVKTMLQLATPSTRQIQLISWGYSVSVTPPGISTVELIQTDVAATVTAHVAAGVQPLDPNAPASLLTLGTSATGYTATVEGSTTATRTFDNQQLGLATGNEQLVYSYQFMPDEERPIVPVSKFLRVRTTFTSTSPLFLCWVCWKELG